MSIIKLVTLPLLKKQVSKKFNLKSAEIEHVYFQVIKTEATILIRVNGIYETDATIDEIGPMNFENVERHVMKTIEKGAALDAFTIGITWPSKIIELNIFYKAADGAKKHIKIENLEL